MSDANSLKSYLVDHNWDHIKVLYGLLGPSESRARSILNSLIEQVDYFPHKVRLCKLDAALNPVFSEGQPPPYATIEQLSYDLRRKAQLVVLWLSNDAIAPVHGVSKYVPGDARSMALLDQFSDMVRAGSSQDRTLEGGLQSHDKTSQRFRAGVFESPTSNDVENLIALVQNPDKWIRWVAVWALGQMKVTPDLRRLAEDPLRLAEADEDQEVRTYAAEARRRLKTPDPDDKKVSDQAEKRPSAAAKWISKMLQLAASEMTSQPLEELKKRCRDLATLRDTQNLLLEMSLNYYEDVRKQAQQSFRAAVVASGVGILFFIAAAVLVVDGATDRATVSLIAGALITAISGVNFYLYGRTARQFSVFNVCLERMNRFLIGHSICVDVAPGDKKDEMRAELVKIMAEAPMLTVDGGAERQDNRQGPDKQIRRAVAAKANRLNKNSNTLGNSPS